MEDDILFGRIGCDTLFNHKMKAMKIRTDRFFLINN